ncbi:hypothetical protein B0J11DRAFT_108782, partial [Dendryphion nanum]
PFHTYKIRKKEGICSKSQITFTSYLITTQTYEGSSTSPSRVNRTITITFKDSYRVFFHTGFVINRHCYHYKPTTSSSCHCSSIIKLLQPLTRSNISTDSLKSPIMGKDSAKRNSLTPKYSDSPCIENSPNLISHEKPFKFEFTSPGAVEFPKDDPFIDEQSPVESIRMKQVTIKKEPAIWRSDAPVNLQSLKRGRSSVESSSRNSPSTERKVKRSFKLNSNTTEPIRTKPDLEAVISLPIQSGTPSTCFPKQLPRKSSGFMGSFLTKLGDYKTDETINVNNNGDVSLIIWMRQDPTDSNDKVIYKTNTVKCDRGSLLAAANGPSWMSICSRKEREILTPCEDDGYGILFMLRVAHDKSLDSYPAQFEFREAVRIASVIHKYDASPKVRQEVVNRVPKKWIDNALFFCGKKNHEEWLTISYALGFVESFIASYRYLVHNMRIEDGEICGNKETPLRGQFPKQVIQKLVETRTKYLDILLGFAYGFLEHLRDPATPTCDYKGPKAHDNCAAVMCGTFDRGLAKIGLPMARPSMDNVNLSISELEDHLKGIDGNEKDDKVDPKAIVDDLANDELRPGLVEGVLDRDEARLFREARAPEDGVHWSESSIELPTAGLDTLHPTSQEKDGSDEYVSKDDDCYPVLDEFVLNYELHSTCQKKRIWSYMVASKVKGIDDVPSDFAEYVEHQTRKLSNTLPHMKGRTARG